MKANQSIRQADEAVSPVIGVILMVAITVVLAAVVFVLVSNLSKQSGESAPDVNLRVRTDNTANEIIIQHVTGETIKDGDMKVSILSAGSGNPDYETCTTGDFTAGSELVASTTTAAAPSAAGSEFCDNTAGTIDSAVMADALANGDYRVVIFHIPSSSILFDGTVTIS